jgi:hypothetical protein
VSVSEAVDTVLGTDGDDGGLVLPNTEVDWGVNEGAAGADDVGVNWKVVELLAGCPNPAKVPNRDEVVLSDKVEEPFKAEVAGFVVAPPATARLGRALILKFTKWKLEKHAFAGLTAFQPTQTRLLCGNLVH